VTLTPYEQTDWQAEAAASGRILPMAQRGWAVAPDLVRLAEIWPVSTDPGAHPGEQLRCGDETCMQAIWPDTVQGRLTHLLQSHGYRMDGKSYDNNNRPVTTATKELQRGEDR
jgi:hypothetical protein